MLISLHDINLTAMLWIKCQRVLSNNMQSNVTELFPNCSKCREYYAKYTFEQVAESFRCQDMLLKEYRMKMEEASKEGRPTAMSKNGILIALVTCTPPGIPISPYAIHEMKHCSPDILDN